MLKGFEDAFVDAQASVISLGLELLSNSGKEAEKIYIYLYRNDEMDYLNFFFEKEGKLYTRDDWFSSGEIRDFFYCAKDDLDNITNVCEAYDAKRPYEFRLIYNVITKALDSKYNYEDIVITGDKNIFDLFEDWFDECGKNITK